MAQTAAGVAAAATLGCVMIGPMGLLVGAAAVGIGVGVMQIPEEQREVMNRKADKAFKKVSDTAFQASESLSNSCATSYKDSGLAEHVPVDVHACLTGHEPSQAEKEGDNASLLAGDDGAGGMIQGMSSRDGGGQDNGGAWDSSGDAAGGIHHDGPGNFHNPSNLSNSHYPNQNNSHNSHGANSVTDGRSVPQGNPSQSFPQQSHPYPAEQGPQQLGNTRTSLNTNKEVACMQEGAIIPVSQIYSLSPSEQPRAWLSVLANAATTFDEKIEAMEEILILAKDKSRARLLVEEGILDSIMWTLTKHMETSNPEPEETKAARLAAACCLRLGKAYCAAMHTDGDLMLMSLYERGSVPEDRQLAQMLAEVPFHVRVKGTGGGGDHDSSAPPEFALTQMTLPQAEEFAKSVKQLAEEGTLVT